VYRIRHEKPPPPLAARCCHVANDLTNFTGDRQTNERTDGQRQTEGRRHAVMPLLFVTGVLIINTLETVAACSWPVGFAHLAISGCMERGGLSPADAAAAAAAASVAVWPRRR